MGSFVLKVNNKILINGLLSFNNKKGGFQQSYRARHAFSYETYNCCTLQRIRNSNFKKFALARLVSSSVNITETPTQVSSSIDVVKTISPKNVTPDEIISSVSKSEIIIDERLLPPIPLPPGSEPTSDVVSQLIESGVEPTFSSLGLASPYWPSGWLQSLLEYLHVTCDMPWWGAIAAVTITLRIGTLPVFLYCKKFSVMMGNLSPQIQEFQIRINKARIAGNSNEVTKVNMELVNLFREQKLSPFQPLIPMGIQAFTFISFFYALQGMAKLPVESMKMGGLFWFKDLTIPDPYYLLPLTTSVTLGFMLQYGSETEELRNAANKYAMRAMRLLPFVMMIFTIHFPSAILCYWTTNNAFSLMQIELLKNKKVLQAFGIPERIKHKKEDLPLSQLSFLDNFKQSVGDAQASSTIRNRQEGLKKQPLITRSFTNDQIRKTSTK